MSWEQLAESVVDAAGKGHAKVSVRGNQMTVRFGLPPERVVRNYTDEDVWLVVRRVYTDGHRWNTTGLARNWKGYPGYDPSKPTGIIRSGRICARVQSRPRLEGIIRSLCMGSGSQGEPSYVEVLAWREDEKYPEPNPYAEVSAAWDDR